VFRSNLECNKILTDAAKGVIRQRIQDCNPQDFVDVKEPPFMLPSTDPDDYSYVGAIVDFISRCADADKWCSFCNDFGETLVLCSTCRIGVCVTSPESSRGCLIWDARINDPTFVFRCPLCTTRSKSSCVVCVETAPNPPLLTEEIQLKLAVQPPDIKHVHFRYDPAVLIVSLTWHGTQDSFANQLRHHLSRKYVNNTSSVSPPTDPGLVANADPHPGHAT